MKICLITHPSPFLLDERVFMHIGVLKIAAVLEQEGHKVDFLDLSGIDNYLDVLDDYLSMDNSATVVGVTATTPQVPYAVKIANHISGKVDWSRSFLHYCITEPTVANRRSSSSR